MVVSARNIVLKKWLRTSSVLGSYPRISIQSMLLWMRNVVCLWCLHCAEACENTQTFALTSVGSHGYFQSVADASSMQSFYTVVSKAWHFLGKILSVLFRFHLAHLLFILHMPLNFMSRFDRLFICTSVIHIWKANPTIKTGKILFLRVSCGLSGCVCNAVKYLLVHMSQMTHCLGFESWDCSLWV